MKLNSQTRVIVATAAALAVVDIAVRLIPIGNRNTAVLGRTTDGVVTAQGFRLVDQWGNERATIGLDGNGEPGIKLFDRFGTERAQLDTFENVPSLILMDKNGARRAYYGMDENTGASQMSTYDTNEMPTSTFTMDGNTIHFTNTNIDTDSSVSNTISTGNMAVSNGN
jgi:hypothetical protein